MFSAPQARTPHPSSSRLCGLGGPGPGGATDPIRRAQGGPSAGIRTAPPRPAVAVSGQAQQPRPNVTASGPRTQVKEVWVTLRVWAGRGRPPPATAAACQGCSFPASGPWCHGQLQPLSVPRFLESPDDAFLTVQVQHVSTRRAQVGTVGRDRH